jgi:hypothetical protein
MRAGQEFWTLFNFPNPRQAPQYMTLHQILLDGSKYLIPLGNSFVSAVLLTHRVNIDHCG